MLQRVDSAELTEWMAYSELEPFGTKMDDLRAGLVAALIYNTNIVDGKGKAPQDMIPWLDRDPEKAKTLTPTEHAEALVNFFVARGAKPDG